MPDARHQNPRVRMSSARDGTNVDNAASANARGANAGKSTWPRASTRRCPGRAPRQRSQIGQPASSSAAHQPGQPTPCRQCVGIVATKAQPATQRPGGQHACTHQGRLHRQSCAARSHPAPRPTGTAQTGPQRPAPGGIGSAIMVPVRGLAELSIVPRADRSRYCRIQSKRSSRVQSTPFPASPGKPAIGSVAGGQVTAPLRTSKRAP